MELKKIKEKLFICYVFIFILCGMFYITRNFIDSFSSKKWEETTGKIISTDTVQRDGNYYLYMKYEYNINGKRYISCNRDFSNQKFSSQESVDDFLEDNNYKIGSKVIAYYDPKDPEKGTLSTGTNFYNIIYFIFLLYLLYRLINIIKEGKEEKQLKSNYIK